MKILVLVLLTFFAISCKPEASGEKLQFFKVEAENFNKFINQKAMPKSPNLQEDIFLSIDYPMELALYKDGKFYYVLENAPNNRDGFGTWEYRGGKLKLYAKRTLFNMHIDLYGLSAKPKALQITFEDRHGTKIFALDNHNMSVD